MYCRIVGKTRMKKHRQKSSTKPSYHLSMQYDQIAQQEKHFLYCNVLKKIVDQC